MYRTVGSRCRRRDWDTGWGCRDRWSRGRRLNRVLRRRILVSRQADYASPVTDIRRVHPTPRTLIAGWDSEKTRLTLGVGGRPRTQGSTDLSRVSPVTPSVKPEDRFSDATRVPTQTLYIGPTPATPEHPSYKNVEVDETTPGVHVYRPIPPFPSVHLSDPRSPFRGSRPQPVPRRLVEVVSECVGTVFGGSVRVGCGGRKGTRSCTGPPGERLPSHGGSPAPQVLRRVRLTSSYLRPSGPSSTSTEGSLSTPTPEPTRRGLLARPGPPTGGSVPLVRASSPGVRVVTQILGISGLGGRVRSRLVDDPKHGRPSTGGV